MKLPRPRYNLPIVSVTITKAKETPKFNCSFENRNRRFYFSKRVINKLGYNEADPSPVEIKIKMFQNSMVEKLNKITLEIEVNEKKKLPLPVLVDDDFDIEFKFDNNKNVLRILIDLNYNLTFANRNEKVIYVHCLVGVDVMQFMKYVKIINYIKMSSWMFPSGIAPFQNSKHFHNGNQIKPVRRKSVEPPKNNYHTITFNYSHCPTSHVNIV